MVMIMVAVTILPVMSLLGTDSQGYSGEKHTVVYSTENLATDGYNINTSSGSITVTYYGTPVAEYNPQFWNEGSFVGEYETYSGAWFPIDSYHVGSTWMFTGWKDLNGNAVDPGNDISSCPRNSDGNIVLEATWGRLHSLKETYGSNSIQYSPDSGNEYTNILLLSGGTYIGSSSQIGNCTVRGMNGEIRLDLTASNGSDPFRGFDDNVIIDNIVLVGHGTSSTQLSEYGIFLEGHRLIVGTNVSTSGHVQFYGGDYNGSRAIDETDMRIFSGEYSNIIGGGGDSYSGVITDTHVTLLGTTSVVEAVIGGGVKSQTGTSNILVYGARVNTNPVVDEDMSAGMSTIIGGSRYAKVDTSNVTITGDSTISAVQGGGREAKSQTNNTYVTISGKAVVSLACGSITDGRAESTGEWAHTPVGSSHVTVTDSAEVTNVYGGGWDIWQKPNYKSTDHTSIIITGGKVTNVYGGGFRGSVGVEGEDSVSISVVGGEVTNVYGGGKGGKDPFSTANASKLAPGHTDTTGRAYVYGDVSITISSEAKITGSVFGGGKGAAKSTGDQNGVDDSASVFGDVRITLNGASIGGSVYGGGEGLSGSTYQEIAKVTGSVSVSVLNGTAIRGDLYGGGCYGAVKPGDSSSPGDMQITITDSTIKGSVYSGGLGESDRMATDVAMRSVVITNGTVSGSVYGGSRYGNDNCESGSGGVTDKSGNRDSYIFVVSGNILGGSSGSVYGAGFLGYSHMDTHVYIGAPAADYLGTAPAGVVSIRSVYGGASVGGSDNGLLNEMLLRGSTDISIGSKGYDSFSISGDVFGTGDFCDISGSSMVTFTDFDQGSSMLSVQKVDELNVIRSKLILEGNMDGHLTVGSPMLSLNMIGQLNIVGAGGESNGSEIILQSAASAISGYSSTYIENPRTVGNYNILRIESGMIFAILGETNAGTQSESERQEMGHITGATLIESDSNDYYGSLVMGLRSALQNSPTFWVRSGDDYIEASTADYTYGSQEVRVWYIGGAYKITQTVVFEDSARTNTELDDSISVLLPKVHNKSTVTYAGYYVNPYAPGSLDVVPGDELKNPGSDAAITFGSGTGAAGYTYFGSQTNGAYDGLDLSGKNSTVPASANLGAKMNIGVSIIGGYSATGFMGSVTMHFVEVSGGLVVNIFDVELDLYLRITGDADKTSIVQDFVMTQSGSWSGSTDVYLPFLKGNEVGTYEIVSVTSSGNVAISTVPTNLNRDGWISSEYRTSALEFDGSSSETTFLGTGGVFSPVLRITYDGSPNGSLEFGDVKIVVKITGGGVTKTVSITLKPEDAPKMQVTFEDKVLDLVGGTKGWSGSIILFTIGVDFGSKVSHQYVAVDKSKWTTYDTSEGGATVEQTKAFLNSIGGSLLEDGYGRVVLFAGESATVPDGYEVLSVRDLLNDIIESKPATAYIDGKSQKMAFVYSKNSPEWYDSVDGFSRFNFESKVTNDISVYAGYSVTLQVKKLTDSPGSINETVLFPGAPGSPVDLEGSVSVQAGYRVVGWYSADDDDSEYLIEGGHLTTYSSTTVYVKLEPIEYTLTITINGGHQNISAGLAGDGIGIVEAGKKYTFTVGEKLTITVDESDGQQNKHQIASVTANDGTWNNFAISGFEITFTSPATDLDVVINVDEYFRLTIEMPSERGPHDNGLFGFGYADSTSPTVNVSTGSEIKTTVLTLNVKNSDKVTISVSDYGDRNVLLSLYKGGSPVNGCQYVYPITLTLDMDEGNATYQLYVNVVWGITTGSGYTASLSERTDHVGNDVQAGTSLDYVLTGDLVLLTLNDNHVFGNGFRYEGAILNSTLTDGSRIYKVNYQLAQKTDVVFGDAEQSSFTVTVIVTFTIRDSHATAMPSGDISVTQISQPVGHSSGMWDGTKGTMTYTFPASELVYSISADFKGYQKSTLSVTVDGDKTVSMTLAAVAQTVSFQYRGEQVRSYDQWYIGDTTTIGQMLAGQNTGGFLGWSDGSSYLKDDSVLDIGMFTDNRLVLEGLPVVSDVEKPVTEMSILISTAQLAAGHTVHVDGDYYSIVMAGDLRVSVTMPDADENITLASTGAPGTGEFLVALEGPDAVLIMHVTVVGPAEDAGRGSS